MREARSEVSLYCAVPNCPAHVEFLFALNEQMVAHKVRIALLNAGWDLQDNWVAVCPTHKPRERVE